MSGEYVGEACGGDGAPTGHQHLPGSSWQREEAVVVLQDRDGAIGDLRSGREVRHAPG